MDEKTDDALERKVIDLNRVREERRDLDSILAIINTEWPEHLVKRVCDLRDLWWESTAIMTQDQAIRAAYLMLVEQADQLVGERRQQDRAATLIAEIVQTHADQQKRRIDGLLSVSLGISVSKAAGYRRDFEKHGSVYVSPWDAHRMPLQEAEKANP